MDAQQGMEMLANEMLGKIKSNGFAPAFVGMVTEEGYVTGDVYASDSPADAEQFMKAAHERAVQLVGGGATVVVVGVCITLFKMGGDRAKEFGLGGPGHGNMFRNQEAALVLTGKKAHTGVAVMGADRNNFHASIYVFAPKENQVAVSDMPLERLEEATGKLFSDLPWPIIH